MTGLQFLCGLGLLVGGAELLVRGASRLAAAVGLSPLVVGLTVVAFGTSAPEFAVSVNAALADQASVAVGNVVGSNLFNVLFILGLSAIIAPLAVASPLIRVHVPIMIGVSALVWLLAADGGVSRLEGALLLTGLVAYTGTLVLAPRRLGEAVAAEEQGDPPRGRLLWSSILVGVGLGLLVLGARWLVGSAVAFAEALGVSEIIVGLTIVAVGTSLPEAVTSIVASLRGERDIAVGNIVGSNLFNLLGVLGAAALAAPGGVDVASSVVKFDLPVMTAVALACLPIFFTGMRIARTEGALLLAYYIAYTTYLVLAATHHDALPAFSAVMLWFAIPVTSVTLAAVAAHAWRRGR